MADASELRQQIRSNSLLAMQAAGETATSIMKRNAPKGSGELEDSIGFEVIDTGSSVILDLYATAAHAKFQDEGTTGSYLIMPSSARALRFEDGGFSAYANHPGVRATGFFSDVIDDLENIVQQLMDALS